MGTTYIYPPFRQLAHQVSWIHSSGIASPPLGFNNSCGYWRSCPPLRLLAGCLYFLAFWLTSPFHYRCLALISGVKNFGGIRGIRGFSLGDLQGGIWLAHFLVSACSSESAGPMRVTSPGVLLSFHACGWSSCCYFRLSLLPSQWYVRIPSGEYR